MLIYTLAFVVLALLSALLGFHGLASGAAGLACLSLAVFVFACMGALLWHLFTSKRSDAPL